MNYFNKSSKLCARNEPRNVERKASMLCQRNVKTIGPFIRGKIGRELYHLYEHVLSNKARLILDEMCRLYGKFAS